MGQSDENHDVYNNLTEEAKKPAPVAKWTIYLALCCITACMGSFNFGFNIGCLNLPTPLIKEFFSQKYAPEYFVLKSEFESRQSTFMIKQNLIDQANMTMSLPDQFTSEEVEKSKLFQLSMQEVDENGTRKIDDFETVKSALHDAQAQLEMSTAKLAERNTFLWAITNSLFVFGGMFGAFSSKYVLEFFGRKKGLLFHYIFSTLGAILALVAVHFDSPLYSIGSIMASRLLFGLQGGMMCGLVPTYLNEVAPAALRGSCGVLNQLCITIGILFSQTLGFRQLLGTKDLWQYILAFPLITSLIGGFVLLFFFSETPKALMITNKDEDATRMVLKRLRNKTDVEDEIDEIVKESKESSSDSAVGFKDLFTLKEYRWPLITSLTLQLTQQLCGINAIFFYSDGIFRRATIADEHIQYAIFATGFINVLCTIAVVPLIEKLGRKPLLVFPMILMIVDFIFLTFCLIMQSKSVIYSYLSIAAIIVFICCFAVGLGPIPFIYATEVFRQEARGAALAVCMTLNWISNLILSLSFEYLAKYLENYVFLVFLVIVTVSVVVIIKKVPETKNTTVDEVLAFFDGKKLTEEDGISKPMLTTSKV